MILLGYKEHRYNINCKGQEIFESGNNGNFNLIFRRTSLYLKGKDYTLVCSELSVNFTEEFEMNFKMMAGGSNVNVGKFSFNCHEGNWIFFCIIYIY